MVRKPIRFTEGPVDPLIKGAGTWWAIAGGYGWAIAFEPGVPGWTEQEKVENCGYTASWKKTASSALMELDGGPWKTFNEAVRACEDKLSQLEGAPQRSVILRR